MIRFSHSANSWQCIAGSNGWHNISVQMARELFDEGFPMWHSDKIIIESLVKD